jgi:hypothetical protein
MASPGWRSILVAFVLAVAPPAAAGPAEAAAPATLTPAQERAVLMAFYQATGGPAWKKRRGWGSHMPVCRWQGVECAKPLADVQVVALRLRHNGLRGTVPASLATLPGLHTLDVSRNPLCGAVPRALIDRANQNVLNLRIDGTSLSQALTSVTIQVDAVTGVCYGDLNTRMIIDARRGQSTIEAVRCHDDPKRDESIMCVRGTTRAPDLEVIARALRRLDVSKTDASGRPDQLEGDHDIHRSTTFTWGDGTTGDLSTVEGNGPLDVRIAQRLLLQLIPRPGEWTAREVACSSLPWAEWVQD